MRAIEYWVIFFAIFLGGDCAHAYCSFSGGTGPIETPLLDRADVNADVAWADLVG